MTRKVSVSGANGFIGRNLVLQLQERGVEVVKIAYDWSVDRMAVAMEGSEMLYHCAGVNRPLDDKEFVDGNVGMTDRVCRALKDTGDAIPVIFTSSVQAERDNAYGKSKRAAEDVILDYGRQTGAACQIYRLPNVFGKWARPGYNSVVATFCDNIISNRTIEIHDRAAPLQLVYIDDVVAEFIELLDRPVSGQGLRSLSPVYSTTVGDLADRLYTFKHSRETLSPGSVGGGLERALYATFLSYMKPEEFAYELTVHRDHRGAFAEMLRTEASGQFSFFTAHPGVTRGGHYHHTKNEKFLVVHGEARFGFRNVLTDVTFEVFVSAASPRVVESVPGWAHDITNVSEDTMVVLIWANETFDPQKPDTITARV